MKLLWKIGAWAWEEASEKVNLAAKWREIRQMGRHWGVRFVVVAVLWEIVEDGVFPFLAWYFGMAWLIPVFLIWHFEPVVYPIFFWVFRTYDRLIGRTRWEADRPAYSSHYRTALKVFVYRLCSIGGLIALQLLLSLNPWLLAVYIVLMTVFNFVHERIWHDSNFGIVVETDEVQPRRSVAKAFTYRVVSVLLLGGVLVAMVDPVPWHWFVLYQGVMLLLYGSLETVWSKNTLLISGAPPLTLGGRHV